MEAGLDFTSLAQAVGGSALVRAYGGTAVCDFLASMATDAVSWQPTAVVLVFSGDDFTPCMAGDPSGSPQYYSKYQADIQTAIDIFRPHGTEVFLIGLPYDASSSANQNIANLNQLYCLGGGGQHRCHLHRCRPGRHGQRGIHVDAPVPSR